MMMMAAAGEGGGCEMEGEVVGDGAGEQGLRVRSQPCWYFCLGDGSGPLSLMVVLGLWEGGMEFMLLL